MTCVVCEQDKKLHARGMCVTCYRRQERAKTSTTVNQVKLLMDLTRILDELGVSGDERAAVLAIISRSMKLTDPQRSGALLFFGAEPSMEQGSVPCVPSVPSVPAVPSVPCSEPSMEQDCVPSVPAVPSVPVVPCSEPESSRETDAGPADELDHRTVPAHIATVEPPRKTPLERDLEAEYKKLRAVIPDYPPESFARLWRACANDFNELRRMVASYEERAVGHGMNDN